LNAQLIGRFYFILILKRAKYPAVSPRPINNTADLPHNISVPVIATD
jgi:hypothetical protein